MRGRRPDREPASGLRWLVNVHIGHVGVDLTYARIAETGGRDQIGHVPMAHALLSGYLARPLSPPVAHACLNIKGRAMAAPFIGNARHPAPYVEKIMQERSEPPAS